VVLLLVCNDRPGAQVDQPSIQITSPLGRTGLPATIRIVARMRNVDAEDPIHVNFYVDGQLLASDADGPPFEANWNDDDPFTSRELMVHAEVAPGVAVADTVILKPLEFSEGVDIMSVALEASISNANGQLIRNLAVHDVELLEDGTAQAIDSFTGQREPALFALLVDSSQSMASRAAALRAGSRRLLDALGPEDEVLVTPFSRALLNITGPTSDRATILDAIAAIRPRGGTAILNALQDAARTLTTQSRRRAIVLLTDGYDEHSTARFDETVDVLRKTGITVYVIGIGGVAGISLKGEMFLSRLAEQTGGRAWFPLDNQLLARAYETLADDVRHRYLITYTPTNQRRDGSYRSILVKPRPPGLRVRARPGYTAPAPPPIRTALEFTAVGSGQLPVSLAREDIEVLEDGVPQTVDTFHDAVAPVTIMLALDASGSMTRSAARAQEAAREFIQAMRPEDELGMILFADRANYIHSPTRRREASLRAIESYAAGGGTALYDALYDSLAQIAAVEGRRVVVVVTDGRDDNAASTGPGSVRRWDDVLRKLRETEATVYAVGIGSRVDHGRLRELADRSGGEAYFPEDVSALVVGYHKILDELRRRYVVGYVSSNANRDGGWRMVEIKVAAGGVAVRSRGGYDAPSE
jgi:VWFA-related protein